MSDQTRPANKSIAIIDDVVSEMMHEFGYSYAEAWEVIADKILYCYEENELDPPTLDEVMETASLMSQIQIVDMTDREQQL